MDYVTPTAEEAEEDEIVLGLKLFPNPVRAGGGGSKLDNTTGSADCLHTEEWSRTQSPRRLGARYQGFGAKPKSENLGQKASLTQGKGTEVATSASRSASHSGKCLH